MDRAVFDLFFAKRGQDTRGCAIMFDLVEKHRYRLILLVALRMEAAVDGSCILWRWSRCGRSCQVRREC